MQRCAICYNTRSISMHFSVESASRNLLFVLVNVYKDVKWAHLYPHYGGGLLESNMLHFFFVELD